MPSKSKVYFFFHEKAFSLKERGKLKKQIAQIFKDERKRLDYLNCVFCSDSEILKINRQFLNHDYFTDVITFKFSETNSPIVGEIYISVDRIRDNAKKVNVSLTNELCRVIFHGALHLCGYKDKSRVDQKEMREKENFYLSSFFTK
jgi:rRNA maturation RNase YbeY